MPKATTKKSSKRTSKSYRLDSKGRIIGPDGKKVAVADGDTPIVISGGSLHILSGAPLEDDDHPGETTTQLHAEDQSKHVTSVQLVGVKPMLGNSLKFAPSNPDNPACTIIIHYE